MGRTTFSGPVRSNAGFIFNTTPSTATVALTNAYAASASLDFPSIAANGVADLTITIPGCVPGDFVAPSWPTAPTAGIMYMAFVSANDTVTVRARNVTAAPIDPPAQTFGVLVLDTAPV